jgi:AraC-like DNA-binding protein
MAGNDFNFHPQSAKEGMILWLFLVLGMTIAFAQNDSQSKKDSLRLVLAHTKGPEKIETYSQLATCYSGEIGDDLKMDTLLSLYDEMYREAIKQDDFKSCGVSIYRRLAAYMNTRMYDEAIKQAPDWLDFLAKQEEWNTYYQVYHLLTVAYIQKGESDDALNRAQRIYGQAKQQKHTDGIAIMLYSIGYIYGVQNRPEEAEQLYRESIQLLQEEEALASLLLRAYSDLCQTLISLKRYDEALSICTEYERAVRRNDVLGKEPVTWVNLFTNYIDLYLELSDYDNAEVYCNKSDSVSNAPFARIITYEARAIIFSSRKQYTKALEMVDKSMELLQGGRAGTINRLRMDKIEILVEMNRAQEVYDLFWEYTDVNDSIRNLEYNAQLDELRTVYEVDKITSEKEKTRNYLLFALAGCLLLAIALGIWIYLHRQIARKNHSLYLQIQALLQKEKKAEQQLLATPEEELSRSMQLFRSLSELMQKEKPFTDPDLKRKKLADRLGTNESYLADAIREATGETFTTYLSNLRLQYSLELLNGQPGMNLDAVSIDSGHGSYASFFRLFMKKYAITPSEYRKLANIQK